MQKISKRLLSVAEEIGTTESFADIGTDHGQLILYALERGITQRAFAVDISKNSLEKARRNLEEAGVCDRVSFFCGDGLKPLPEIPDVVVIAGMGGHEIVKILTEEKRVKKAVLLPHQDAHLVRKYLIENGYRIEKDYIVADGKYYAVIVASPGKSEYTEEEILLGKNNPKREDYNERNKKRKAAIEMIMKEQNVTLDALKDDIKKEYEVLEKWSKSSI